jgi:hypothetical protein
MKKIYFTEQERLVARKARQLRYYYRNQKAKIDYRRQHDAKKKRLKEMAI